MQVVLTADANANVVLMGSFAAAVLQGSSALSSKMVAKV